MSNEPSDIREFLFTNEKLKLEQLPKFEMVSLNRLHSSYMNVILINLGIVFTICLGGVASLFLIDAFDLFLPYFLKILILFFVVAFFVVLLFYYKIKIKKMGYAFRAHDVLFKKGVLVERTIIIPNCRVQHIVINRGFFSRIFGLASIELFTAGGGGSDLEIHGLLYEEAQKIKDHVSKIIHLNQNDISDENNDQFLDKKLKEEGTDNNSIIENGIS